MKVFDVEIGSKWKTTGDMYTWCITTGQYALVAGGKNIKVISRGEVFGMPCWVVAFELNGTEYQVPSDQFFALAETND